MITVRDILIERLLKMGADGLYRECCGCGIDDLAPCEQGAQLDCVPARHIEVSPESHAEYKEYPNGYFVPLLPETSPCLCLWHSYQQHPTSEKCGRWLKHRAWMKQSGGCRK